MLNWLPYIIKRMIHLYNSNKSSIEKQQHLHSAEMWSQTFLTQSYMTSEGLHRLITSSLFYAVAAPCKENLVVHNSMNDSTPGSIHVYGDRILYMCVENYWFHRDVYMSHVTCGSGGQWSPRIGHCKGEELGHEQIITSKGEELGHEQIITSKGEE